MRLMIMTLALTVAGIPAARAQFCVVCGTNPCRQVARSKNLPVHEPPSPTLSPEGNLAVGSLASRILRSAADLKGTLEWKLVAAKPINLLISIEQIAASYQDIKNPSTFEQWGLAVQADALLKIVRSVTKKTLRPVPSRIVQDLLKLDDINSKLHPSPPLSESRVDQYFRIFDESTRELRDLPRQGAAQTGIILAGYTERVDDESPEDVRARLWNAMLAAYHETGQFDQLVEFHALALERWGAVADPEIRDSIERLAADAKGALGLPVAVNPAELGAGSVRLSSNSALFVSFRASDGPLQFTLELTGKRAQGAPRPERPDGVLILHPDETRDGIELYVNGVEIPTGLTASLARSEWNALKLAYRQGVVTFALNGRTLGRFQKRVLTAYRTSYDEQTKRLTNIPVHAAPDSYSVKLFGRGRFRLSSRTLSQ